MESLPNLGRLTMTQAQTIRFKKAIENHRRELVSEIHSQTRQIVIAESEHDPIDQVRKRILDGNIADENKLKEIDKEVKDLVTAAADFAQESPEPDPAELWTNVLAEA